MLGKIIRMGTAVVAVAVLAGGASTTVLAKTHGGNGGGNNTSGISVCSNNSRGGHITVECLGLLNGNQITIDVNNVKALNNVQLLSFQNVENLLVVNVGNNDLNNNTVQLDLNNIASGTQTNFKNVSGQLVSICQVKVIEVGLQNNNNANCK